MEAQIRFSTITGARGELRWGYHLAAVLETWTATKTESGSWALTGTPVGANTFWVSQRPLMFLAPNGWRWPVETLQITGASCSAMLGPKELSDAKRTSP